MPPVLRSSAVTVRPDLGDAIVEATVDESGLIGHQVLPFHPVENRANEFKILTREARLQQPDPAYSGHGASIRVRSEVDADTYSCVPYSLEHELGDMDRMDFSGSYDIETEAAELPVRINLLRFERRVSAKVFNTTTFPLSGTTGLDTAVTWPTIASSTPITDVSTAKANLLSKNGVLPDMMITTWQNYQYLCQSAQVADRLKYDGSYKDADVPVEALARVLGLQKILIAGAFYNANALGEAASINPCWSNSYAMVCYSTPSDARGYATGPMRTRPQIGRTFLWEKFGVPREVYEYREDNNAQDVYRSRICTDEKIFGGSDFGFLLKVD
jgi:hypothetical protein